MAYALVQLLFFFKFHQDFYLEVFLTSQKILFQFKMGLWKRNRTNGQLWESNIEKLILKKNKKEESGIKEFFIDLMEIQYKYKYWVLNSLKIILINSWKLIIFVYQTSGYHITGKLLFIYLIKKYIFFEKGKEFKRFSWPWNMF